MEADATHDVERARLYWQCRRGMRELDLLLQGFLESGFDTLSVAERDVFQRLLSYPDQLLLEYFMGRLSPGDTEVADVVDKIRAAAP